jgi:RNA polymerase sigma-70 factor (ECF subfamily)
MMRTMRDDEEARQQFARLFDAHRHAVLGYALRRCGEPADAADVLAETFLVAWRRLNEVPAGEHDERPWLLGVARRVLANQRRGAARRSRLSERLGQELPAVVPATDELVGGVGGVVADALARLDPDDRELLQLTSWEGLDPAQIAAALGVPGATVRSRLHRARARLRAELEALGMTHHVTEEMR